MTQGMTELQGDYKLGLVICMKIAVLFTSADGFI